MSFVGVGTDRLHKNTDIFFFVDLTFVLRLSEFWQ